MLKKFLLLCFVIMAFGIVPSLAETIGPVQQGNLITVNFTLPDDLQGAVYLDMTLEYPRDVFLLVPTDSISDDRIVEYDFNSCIPAGKTYSPQFLVLPSAADGTYTINLPIHIANDRKAENIEGLTIVPCAVQIGPLPSHAPTPTHTPKPTPTSAPTPTVIPGLSSSSEEQDLEYQIVTAMPAKPALGVTLGEFSKYYSGKMPHGPYIISIMPGSPAESGGLQIGDFITKFNGQWVRTYAALMTELNKCQLGEEIEIRVYRDDQFAKQVKSGMQSIHFTSFDSKKSMIIHIRLNSPNDGFDFEDELFPKKSSVSFSGGSSPVNSNSNSSSSTTPVDHIIGRSSQVNSNSNSSSSTTPVDQKSEQLNKYDLIKEYIMDNNPDKDFDPSLDLNNDGKISALDIARWHKENDPIQ